MDIQSVRKYVNSNPHLLEVFKMMYQTTAPTRGTISRTDEAKLKLSWPNMG